MPASKRHGAEGAISPPLGIGEYTNDLEIRTWRFGAWVVPSTRKVAAHTRPVVDDWLNTAVASAAGDMRTIARLLGDAAGFLPWLTSYEHLDPSLELDSFRSHYSFQLLIGPSFRGHDAPVTIIEILVGFTSQAPNVLYPAHHHLAPELYCVISGSLEWQVGDNWSVKEPDTAAAVTAVTLGLRINGIPIPSWWAPIVHNSNDISMGRRHRASARRTRESGRRETPSSTHRLTLKRDRRTSGFDRAHSGNGDAVRLGSVRHWFSNFMFFDREN